MKRTSSLFIGALIFILVGVANSLNSYYEWKPLATGGGGWVTGIDFGTDEGGYPVLIRTDRGGCYRYDSGNKRWDNIVTDRNLPADDPLILAGNYGGSLAIVSAPANPDRAYMAFGNDRTTIYSSENSGDTWQPTALKDLPESSNGDGKITGPRLAVDPFSSDIVFYASASSGLFVTTNRGATWTTVTGLPGSGETTYGVTSVIFNAAHGTVYDSELKRERCRVVYCSIWRVGIFLSRDGGYNWVKISRGDSGDFRIPADDAQVPRLALGQSVDPLLFVVDTFAGFYRYKYNDVNNTGTWRLFNPEGSRTDWRTIAVSPKNSNVILMVDSVGGIWRTVDGGDTFTNQLPLTRNSTGDVAWLDSVEDEFMIVGDVVFDPFVENRIWLAEGTGVWYADNVASSSRINWISMTKGIEGLVSMTAVHPPNGDLITGHQNRAIFLHSSDSKKGGLLDTVYPASYGPTKRFNSAWDIQYSAGDPRFLVANVFDQRQCCSTPQSPDNQAAYSTNGGKDWKIFTGITTGTWPVDYKFGNIAVAAMDTKNIVVLPTADLAPMYSLDRGVTWNISVLPDTNGTAGSHSSFNLWRSVLTSDSVQDGTFYIFHSATLRLYVSRDGGATWNYTDSTTRLPPLSNLNAKLRAHPTLPGTLMLSYGPLDGRDTGLFVTSDGGQNWRQLPGIRSVRNFAWGAPRNATANFTLYAQAKNASNPLEGPVGIFCSLDNGETWGRLTRYPLGIPATAQAMAADMNTFGRVYVGFPGNGFAFGQLNPDAPDFPETFCTAKWDSSLTFKSPGTESAASSLTSTFFSALRQAVTMMMMM